MSCAEACEFCATSDLKEQDVKMMASCAQINRECAAVCWTSSALMSMDSHFAKQFCNLCADICSNGRIFHFLFRKKMKINTNGIAAIANASSLASDDNASSRLRYKVSPAGRNPNIKNLCALALILFRSPLYGYCK